MGKIAKILGMSPPAMAMPAPPPPPPMPDDPAIAAREKEVAASERRRRGRRASQLAPSEENLGDAPVNRPAARDGAQLLGESV